jgi:PII-like signaling protein
MKHQHEAQLLRIFLGENDVHDGRPVHQLIIEEARSRGFAGATVLRGIAGFGAQRIVAPGRHKTPDNPPVVVEIVDREDRIEGLMPFLDGVVKEGLVTVEAVRVITYRSGKG